MTATPMQRGTDLGAKAEAGLSIIVPVYNEASGLANLHARIAAVARELRQTRGLACEVVYVDDGSRDDSLKVARGLAPDGLDIQVISLSRNFGKEAALLAGLDHARRAAVLFMDADGQHPPTLIGTLVGHWLDGGYDVVYTAKAHRANESALRQLPERNRFFKGLASWIGFRQLRVDYEPADRTHGETSWSYTGLLGLSVEGLTSFSVAPLRVASLLGVLLAASALLTGLWLLIEAVIFERTVPGYPSLIVSVMVIGGVQLLMIGVMGEYIGKILSELKARPVYFVAEHSVKPAEDHAARTAAE